MQIRVALVHAEQFGRKQGRLFAAGAGPHLQDGIALIRLILRQQQNLDVLFQLRNPLFQLLKLGHGQLVHRRVIAGFRDQLGQIAQFQRTALNRDTCSIISPYKVEDMARLTGCEYLSLDKEDEAEMILADAFKRAKNGKPVLVEVAIDYSRKTYFTKGVVATNFWRLPLSERLRMIGRVAVRKLGA